MRPCIYPAEELAETWEVVFRNGHPVAAFKNRGLADEFIQSERHRNKDTVARRRITFKGLTKREF